MILLIRIKSQKSDFETARQSQINFKMANKSKYGNFNFVVEYPIGLSIKRTLTGKLALDGQNLIYCVQFEKNLKKKLIPGKLLFDFLIWETLIFNLVAALRSRFKCASFEYQHCILSRNLNFRFYKGFQNVH